MAARGAEAKEVVFGKLIADFGGFYNGKEFRIPLMENGVEVQLKVALTCAKDNVAVPEAGSTLTATSPSVVSAGLTPPDSTERSNLENLLNTLGV